MTQQPEQTNQNPQTEIQPGQSQDPGPGNPQQPGEDGAGGEDRSFHQQDGGDYAERDREGSEDIERAPRQDRDAPARQQP